MIHGEAWLGRDSMQKQLVLETGGVFRERWTMAACVGSGRQVGGDSRVSISRVQPGLTETSFPHLAP